MQASDSSHNEPPVADLPDRATVWVVEDSRTVVDRLCEALGAVYALERFVDGESVLEALVSRRPDLVVLDWQLPGISGLEVLSFLRQRFDEYALPVLMLSVRNSRADILEALAATANDYVAKPYDDLELLARVKTLIGVRQAIAQRERAVRGREDMMSIVSHDLRNPLSTIILTASKLARTAAERGDGDVLRRQSGMILRAAGQMTRMVGDLLDLSAMEAGRGLAIEKEHVDAGELVVQTLEAFEPLAQARRITLQFSTPADGCPVSCDADRISQVLSNLLGNAIKFTHEDGKVNVSVQCDGNEVVFSVDDDGVGIAPEQLPHVFDAYWQAKVNRRGVGLGLSVVKGIVEAHGGRLWVRSDVGRGSTCSFALPGFTKDASI